MRIYCSINETPNESLSCYTYNTCTVHDTMCIVDNKVSTSKLTLLISSVTWQSLPRREFRASFNIYLTYLMQRHWSGLERRFNTHAPHKHCKQQHAIRVLTAILHSSRGLKDSVNSALGAFREKSVFTRTGRLCPTIPLSSHQITFYIFYH
jgi:hypothetical protein